MVLGLSHSLQLLPLLKMPTYSIVSDKYADYSMTVHAPFVIAYGVAESIHKQQRVNVSVVNADGEVVQVFSK